MVKNKIIFFGTSEFAVLALEALVKNGYGVAAVITTSDEPVGRKQILAPPPIKIAAEKLGLKIFQPKSLKETNGLSAYEFMDLSADLGIVASYGKIIPQQIIDSFKFGVLNIHPSLLPKYRGPSPIQYALLNGEKETGVTIMKIDEQVDHGPLIENRKWKIENRIKYEELNSQLSKIGAELLIKILPDYLAGKIKPIEQDHDQATFTKMIKKEDGKIDWNKSAEQIYNQFRAFHLWPGIWTTWRPSANSGQVEKILKITGCIPLRSYGNEIIEIGNKIGIVQKKDDKILVSCNNGYLEILRLQLEGGKEMSAHDFLSGHKDFIGSQLKWLARGGADLTSRMY